MSRPVEKRIYKGTFKCPGRASGKVFRVLADDFGVASEKLMALSPGSTWALEQVQAEGKVYV